MLRLRAAIAATFVVLASTAVFAQSRATVTVDTTKALNRISPLLFGQFAEFMFEDIKGGLWAELVRDRSFEEAPNALGLPRYWERDPDDRNDDAIHFAWDAAASINRPSDPTQQTHSLRVRLPQDDGQRRGIRQSRVPIRAGLQYHGSLWIKTADFYGRVVVALEQDRSDGERYASAEFPIVAGDWRTYEFTLSPTQSDPLAKLAILFYGRGRVWLDQVSLMPGDATGGVRADVFARIDDEHPRFVRWPGGNVAQDYHWRWGVGVRDQRPIWVNLSWGKELEPSDFGTDEYIAFCRAIGAEPTLVVNVEGRGATAQEAADWVQYVNGPPDSPMGKLRAQNGHPQPYGVRIWEVGNEIWGTWVRGHSDAATYARNLNRYVAAMRAVDPTIKIVGVGDNNMNWNRTVLGEAGRSIDYLAIHHYYGLAEMAGDARNLMAHPLFYERFYQQVRDAIHELVPGHDIKLAINEWNTSLPLPRQHSMESALYGARLMNVFERSGDLIAMSAVSDMVNGWSGGVIQASRDDVFVTPTYLAIKLYNDHLGSERVASTVESPTFDTTKEGKRVPYLDVVATRSAGGKQLFIHAVNADAAVALLTTINVAALRDGTTAALDVLNGPTLDASNTFRAPDTVRVQHSEIPAGPHFTVELPAHSVAVITIPLS